MRKLLEFGALCAFGTALAFLMVEWFAGCGETYIDSKGVRHANECLFLDLHK